MSLRLLRGRVMIKPIKVAPSKIIDVVESDKRDNRPSLGRGIVLDMGAPAFAKDGETEVQPHFKIGDEVLHIGQHVSREGVHPVTGERVRYCAQEEVCGVIE